MEGRWIFLEKFLFLLQIVTSLNESAKLLEIQNV